MMPETFVTFRSTQDTQQTHPYFVVEPRCNTIQFQISLIPSTSELWNSLDPGVFIFDIISKCTEPVMRHSYEITLTG